MSAVDLELAKLALRVDGDFEDALIQTYIDAAEGWVSWFTGGLVLAEDDQSGRSQVFDRFGSALQLPCWPVIEVLNVSYIDAAGISQELPTDRWRLLKSKRPARVSPAIVAWPQTIGQPEAVTVTYRAGFKGDLPGEIQAAVLLVAGHLNTNRDQVIAGQAAAAIEVPFGARDMLRRWREATL